MTAAQEVFDIFMHNANYARMLFGTFPLLRVNRYYRDFVNGSKLAGASYHHDMCMSCGKPNTICLYKQMASVMDDGILCPRDSYPKFICLACSANVTRPWRDYNAQQFIGYVNEGRPKFLIDLKCWGWSYAMRMAEGTPGGAMSQATEVGEYLASQRTWKLKWMDLFLTQKSPRGSFRFRLAVMQAYYERFHALQVALGNLNPYRGEGDRMLNAALPASSSTGPMPVPPISISDDEAYPGS